MEFSCCCHARRPEAISPETARRVKAQSFTNSSSSAISNEKMPSASVTAKPKIRLPNCPWAAEGLRIAAAVRNPSAAQGQFGNLIFGFAVTEALGIFSLLIALLLLFVF